MIAIAHIVVAAVLLRTVAASPLIIGAHPMVTLYVTADTCLPTGGSIPVSSAVAPMFNAAGIIGIAASSTGSSASQFVGGSSSVTSVASTAPTIASSVVAGVASPALRIASAAASPSPSVVSAAAAAGTNAIALSGDAALVSAVGTVQTNATALVTSVNTLFNVLVMISKGIVTGTPMSVATSFADNTLVFAAALQALETVVENGLSQAGSRYLGSSVPPLTATLNSLTTQVQQLETSGTSAANLSSYASSLGEVSTALQSLSSALFGGSNAAVYASAVVKFNDAVLALTSPNQTKGASSLGRIFY
ncbi:hypothetical protein B0H15DRAFT_953047 [Mycena belliarum]|uniref:Uncharacterized protein n=1 Tax=Mycena belliarum TaxID=1033014 RepID=A0AAD6XKP2_9AGAR|nr:hypothetical protein B0H15DRAFT_953047 [Mycena belliae]